MITCKPTGWTSWNFELQGPDFEARMGFGWPQEKGWITVGKTEFSVEKQGFTSGTWHLLHGSQLIAVAEKRSAFNRSFRIDSQSKHYELEALSWASRTMRLNGPDCDAVMSPAHCFTRRATIKGQMEDLNLVAFSFWLTLITWRRANNNAASG